KHPTSASRSCAFIARWSRAFTDSGGGWSAIGVPPVVGPSGHYAADRGVGMLRPRAGCCPRDTRPMTLSGCYSHLEPGRSGTLDGAPVLEHQPLQARDARADGLDALGVAPAERLRDQDREPIPLRAEDAVALRFGDHLAVGSERAGPRDTGAGRPGTGSEVMWFALMSMPCSKPPARPFGRWQRPIRAPVSTGLDSMYRIEDIVGAGSTAARPRAAQRPRRSGRKNARTSSTSARGSSMAAKWPPRSMRVQRCTLKTRSAQARGGLMISRGKMAQPVGTSTRSPLGGNLSAWTAS